MAQIQVKNPVTGAIFTINDTDFDSVYKPLGWTKVGGTTNTPVSQQTNVNNAQQPTASNSNKTFYRVGADIYDASTNQRIGSTDWNNNWSGRATEVSAPSINIGSVANASGSLSNAPLGASGVNHLFKMYYGRNATQDELNYWSNKSDAELRPKLEPNSATELEKQRQGFNQGNIGNQEGIQETPGGVDLSMYDEFIKNDPFLTEQFEDETLRENFSKMSPTLQMAYIQMMQSLGRTIEAGKVINPNIEITPEKIKEFTDQATKELDPYYQEQINNYKKDLETSISRLKEDFSKGVRNAEEPFKRNLAAVAESEAQAGLTYGSERAVREKTNIKGQQDLIDENALNVSRLAEDAYKQTERTLGSDVLSGISMPSLQNYNVSKQGFAEAGLRNLYTPQGGMIGSLQKERTTNIKSRTSELEDAYRRQRILNTSQL